MNMRQFYQKIKEVEGSILTAELVIVSNDTPDGGKAGVKSEVKRSVASRMIAEGHARIATEEETQTFRRETEEGFQRGQEAIHSAKVQLAVLSDAEMKAIKVVVDPVEQVV